MEAPAGEAVWGFHAGVTALLLVLLVVIAFFPCLQNDFVNWDDDTNFLENPSYRGLGWAQLRWDWTSFHIGVYQPLAWMILGAEYLLFGLEPWGYHLTSLILHALNTVVLFVFTVSLLARCPSGRESEDHRRLMLAAGLAAALFAVHPLRTEVVAWASCQPYLSCALFCMLAVLAYLQAFRDGPTPGWGWMVATFALFLAALLCKAVAVTLPAVLLILDVYPLRRLGGGPGRWLGPSVRRVWWEKVPFAVLSLVFIGLAIVARVENIHPANYQQSGFAARLSRSCHGIGHYLIKTVLPTNVTAFYPVPERLVWFESPFVWCILGALGVSVALFLLRRRWPSLLTVWLSYLVILAPNLGLLGIGPQIAADRYSYISMIGGVVLLAAGLSRTSLARLGGGFAAVGLTAASLAALLGLILLTQAQCRTWRTTETLWTHVLNHGGSRCEVAHTNLGANLNAQGRSDEARVHFEEALRLNPDYPEAHCNLGLLLLGQGRSDEARAHLEEALRFDPNLPVAHNNLGAVLKAQGRSGEARAQFEEALRLNPDYPESRCNLGLVLLAQGRLDEARAQFEEALRFKPNLPVAHNNLGVVLRDQGRSDEARARFEEALRFNPKDPDAHCNLGLFLLGQGRNDEARAHFEEAVRFNPNDPDVHFNLGLLLLRQGRIDEARARFDATLRINPKLAMAYNERAMIRATAALAKYRDGPRTVEDATHACALTDWKNAGFLDTLAAAHAEAADFDAAVKWQTRALDLLNDETQKEDFRSRLRLYQAKQPYHTPTGGALTADGCPAGPRRCQAAPALDRPVHCELRSEGRSEDRAGCRRLSDRHVSPDRKLPRRMVRWVERRKGRRRRRQGRRGQGPAKRRRRRPRECGDSRPRSRRYCSSSWS